MPDSEDTMFHIQLSFVIHTALRAGKYSNIPKNNMCMYTYSLDSVMKNMFFSSSKQQEEEEFLFI